MEGGGALWSLITIVGPMILLAVLAWAVWRNRQSRIPKSTTEAGTKRVYDEEERKRRTGSDDEGA